MKTTVKNVIITTAMMMVIRGVGADIPGASTFNPYTGFDYYHAWMKGRATDGQSFDRVYPSSYPGLTFYVANKFTENFGLELGLDTSIRAKRDWETPINNTIVKAKTNIRRRSFHMDLIGFLPANEQINVIGTIGYGWMRPQIELTDDNNNEIATFKTKERSILRAGIGADCMLNDIAGFRGKVGWESTAMLRIKEANGDEHTFKAFKNSMTLALGVFFKF